MNYVLETGVVKVVLNLFLDDLNVWEALIILILIKHSEISKVFEHMVSLHILFSVTARFTHTFSLEVYLLPKLWFHQDFLLKDLHELECQVLDINKVAETPFALWQVFEFLDVHNFSNEAWHK